MNKTTKEAKKAGTRELWQWLGAGQRPAAENLWAWEFEIDGEKWWTLRMVPGKNVREGDDAKLRHIPVKQADLGAHFFDGDVRDVTLDAVMDEENFEDWAIDFVGWTEWIGGVEA